MYLILSSPGIISFPSGVKQNSDDNGPHFDLARPDNPKTLDRNEEAEANSKIEGLVKTLQDKGVKDKKD